MCTYVNYTHTNIQGHSIFLTGTAQRTIYDISNSSPAVDAVEAIVSASSGSNLSAPSRTELVDT